MFAEDLLILSGNKQLLLCFIENELNSYFDVAVQNEELHICLFNISEYGCIRWFGRGRTCMYHLCVCERENYQQVWS